MSHEADSAGVVEAMRRVAAPLRGVVPDSSFDDLRPLAAIIGDAVVVGLGEAAHGAGELFTLKHRLIEYMVVELGFTAVAFEASYSGCRPIDDYVRQGIGSAAEALTGQGYTAWDTEEVSALVGWLRNYNNRVTNDRKVGFYGLDSGYNAVSRLLVLESIARIAPKDLAAAREAFASLESLEPKWPFRFNDTDDLTFRHAYETLQQLQTALVDTATSHSADDNDLSRRSLRIMAQWAGPDRGDRSRHMAANLFDIMAGERSDARFVVWQHNGHVGRGTADPGMQSFGDVLSERLGHAYRAIALEFGDGQVHTRRRDPDGHSGAPVALRVPSPPKGSLPWVLSSTGLRSFMIDLRQLDHDPQLGQWLSASQTEHAVGWTHDPSSLYHEGHIGAQYDAVAFVDHVTPTHPTPNALQAFARRERY